MGLINLKLVDKSVKICSRVYCTMRGLGTIVVYKRNLKYPLKVRFDNPLIIEIYSYTITGRANRYMEATLYRIPSNTSSKDVTVTVTLNIK